LSNRRFAAVLLLSAFSVAAVACEMGERPRFEVRMPFAVKYATPAGGLVATRDVAARLAVFAAFSAPIDPASVDGVALVREGVPVEGTVSVGPRPHELSVAHGELAVGDYEFVLPAGLRSAEGDALGIEVRIPFRVDPAPGP
jgi:hypothetical protein